MGNIIISNDFISLSDSMITARSGAIGYPKVNITDLWHLKRRFRADDATESDTNYLLKFNLGSAQTIDAIFLNDVNFDKVHIRGHASDLGTNWSTSSFTSGDLSISQNKWTGRYQVYIPLTSFNYQYLAILVPTASSMVGSYTTKFEVGTVVLMDSVQTFSLNMAYGYTRTAGDAFVDLAIAGASKERVSLNPNMRWQGEITFGNRALSDETEILTMNRLTLADPLVFYENANSTQDAYLCARSNAYKGVRSTYNIAQHSDAILLEELV